MGVPSPIRRTLSPAKRGIVGLIVGGVVGVLELCLVACWLLEMLRPDSTWLRAGFLPAVVSLRFLFFAITGGCAFSTAGFVDV